jgi:hypothetical protein
MSSLPLPMTREAIKITCVDDDCGGKGKDNKYDVDNRVDDNDDNRGYNNNDEGGDDNDDNCGYDDGEYDGSLIYFTTL